MKKKYAHFITSFLCLGLVNSFSFGQCTLLPTAEVGVVLDGINVTNTGISVAYNPTNDLYYAGDGGYTSSNLVTFNSSGTELAAGINCGYDFRGLWWNPNTDDLEANAFSSTGIRRCNLDGSFYGLNSGTIILPNGQPTAQSQGDYDWDDDEIIYYYNGSIYRYSHTTGAFISSYAITGLPVSTSNLSSETIGYSGCPGQEIVLYDLVLQRAYTINKSTGAYVGTSAMPGGAVSPGAWYNVSYANGQIFIRSGNDWYGYRIFPSCSEISITVSDYEVCEGDEVTLEAEGAGTITWDGGVVDGVPFIPGGAGVYEYTPSSDDPLDCAASPVEIVVIEFSTPTVVAGAGDLVFCVDEMITLSAGGDADLYSWNDGDPLDLMPGVGTYTFELQGEYLDAICTGISYDEVTVEVVDLPAITGSVDMSPVCIGNEVVFSGSGGTVYDWDLGVMNEMPFETTEVGTTTYTVVGTDENGCVNSATVELEVVDLVSVTGVVSDVLAGGDGSIDITVSGGAPGYSFDWDNDGTGDFDDTEDLSGLSAGLYTVVIESDAGCSTEASFYVDSQLGIAAETENTLSVYPNPTQGDILISWKGNFNYTLSALNGDVIFSGQAQDSKLISLAELADGVYFVSITSEEQVYTVKVVKK